MSGRPAGAIPQWATDTNYPAGPDAWNGTPTKVNLGAVALAAGFVPGASVPAQFINHTFAEYGKWLDYLDTIEARNWSVPLPPTDDIKALGRNCNVLRWDAFGRRLWWAGTANPNADDDNTPLVLYSFDGVTWIPEIVSELADNGNAQSYQLEPAADGTIIAWLTRSEETQIVTFRGTDGDWDDSVNLPNNHQFFCGVWAGDRWLLAGANSDPAPVLYTVTIGDVWTALTLENAGTLNDPITMLAIGSNGWMVAISDEGLWRRSEFSGTWQRFTLGALFDGAVPKGLVWWETEGCFVVIGDDRKVYTSTAGLTWTERFEFDASFSFAAMNGSPGDSCLAVFGGTLVAACAVDVGPGSAPALAIGRDLGQTWDSIQVPAVGGSGSLDWCQAIVGLDNRFAVVAARESDSAGCRVSFSMRSK